MWSHPVDEGGEGLDSETGAEDDEQIALAEVGLQTTEEPVRQTLAKEDNIRLDVSRAFL